MKIYELAAKENDWNAKKVTIGYFRTMKEVNKAEKAHDKKMNVDKKKKSYYYFNYSVYEIKV